MPQLTQGSARAGLCQPLLASHLHELLAPQTLHLGASSPAPVLPSGPLQHTAPVYCPQKDCTCVKKSVLHLFVILYPLTMIYFSSELY